MTTLLVRGVCPHDCPDTCGVITEVEDGRAIGFRGDPAHATTRGWLCAKVRPYLEHVYHPDRLLYPLRRVGPKGAGEWRRVTWKEAIDEVAARWQGIFREHGAPAILPYSYSGTLGLVQMSVASGRFWNRLGASQLERSICGAAAELAVEATLGARWSQPYADVVHSKLVIVWGHNPVSTAPHFMPFLRAAQRNGCLVVVIDPRRSLTAQSADLHLAPLPGSDGALALSMAHVLVAEGLHDESWLGRHTVGWPQLRERLALFPPERAASVTGLSKQAIVDLARLYGSLKPGLIKIADGINRNKSGGQNVRAICMLPALTGQYGRRGGGLAYSTSGYLKWDRQAVNYWHGSRARAINMNRLGAALLGEAVAPPIKSLFVFGANPATSSPNSGKIVQGLRRDDLFTVVHELFLTDTADYADLVLPATSQLEQTDLHKAYGHTFLTYNRPAIAPLGECKSNWEVMGLLASAMGFHEPWLHQSADEVIAEVLAATAASTPALRGITLERLQAEGTVPLAIETATPFADGQFPTPSGKVELYSQRLADLGLDPLPGGFDEAGDDGGFSEPSTERSETRTDCQSVPAETDGLAIHPTELANLSSACAQEDSLQLITAGTHHFVSSSLASQAGLLRSAGPPTVEIHPADAAARGIVTGAPVIVENARGWCRIRAVVTDAVRPGVAISPKGRWSKLSGGRNVNWTTSDALGDMAGQSTFHSNRVWIRPAEDG